MSRFARQQKGVATIKAATPVITTCQLPSDGKYRHYLCLTFEVSSPPPFDVTVTVPGLALPFALYSYLFLSAFQFMLP